MPRSVPAEFPGCQQWRPGVQSSTKVFARLSGQRFLCKLSLTSSFVTCMRSHNVLPCEF
jgi:hypothetical protein